jgi:nicotinamidase-related amidase
MTELSASARQVPPPPDPVAVTLDPATTALLVMDITEATCGPQPNCREMLPRLAALVARARSAGLPIVYTSGATSSPVLPDVSPGPGDPVIQGSQNKFFNTQLDDILRPRGVRTLVLSGWRTNGSVTYTSHGATNLGYTVVVPVDGTAAAESFQVAIGLYQVLNLLSGNASNEPLKAGAVTLSRTDLITFR